MSFPGFSQVTLQIRSTRQGTERTNADEGEVTRSFQIHKSLPWGYIGEFMQPGVTNTLLKHTNLLPAAGRLAQPPPIVLAGKGPVLPAALGPSSSRREWDGLRGESSRLLAPRQGHCPEGSCRGTCRTQALLRPRGAQPVPGEAAMPCPRRSGQWHGRHIRGDHIKITGLVRASSISLLRVNYNSSPCAQGGNNWGKHTQ